MKLAITVIAYNRLNLLKDCLGSLLESTKTPFSLKVLDNASTDRRVLPFLKSMAAKNKFVEILENKTNDGCGPIRFKLINESDCDIFISIDSDMVLTPGWEKPLIDELSCRPELGAVGSLIVNPDNLIHSNGGCINHISKKYICLFERDCGADFTADSQFESAPCEWLPGGAMAIRGNAAKKLIRSEHVSFFRFGFNDAHIALMLKDRGFTLGTRCDSVVFHMRDKIEREERNHYYANREDLSTLCISIMQFEKVHHLNPCFSWKLIDRLTAKSHPTIHDAETFFEGLKYCCTQKELDVCSESSRRRVVSYINQYHEERRSFESMRARATSAGLNQDWHLSVELWKRIEKTFPGQSPFAIVKTAQALRHLKRYEEAKSILIGEIEKDRVPVYVRAELAELAMAQERWTEAVERWQDLKRNFPGQWRDLPHRMAISLAELEQR